MAKLEKRQKKLIAKAFDKKKECPKEYGYMKGGQCIPHKKAKKPKGPSLKKSIKRGVKQQVKLLKKGLTEDGKVVI